MNRDILRQIINVVSVLGTIGVNIAADALPFNNLNTAQISDSFHVYFVPAGYVFAIWGVIYIGWLAYVTYQALPAQRENGRLRRVGYLFALSGVANSAWLVFWHYQQFTLTVITMLTLLALLIAIYLRLDIGRAQTNTTEKWCVDIPFSVYLGWITVATIANITDWLDFVKWNQFGIAPEIWAVVMLVVALVVGVLMAVQRADRAYLFVLAWSFVGIALKQVNVPLVPATAWIVAGVALALAVFAVPIRKRFQLQHS